MPSPKRASKLAIFIAITVLLQRSTMGDTQESKAPVRREHPNVILMMADDLGYNDLSCYGSTKIKTPQLDKLARQGIRLTGFYAGCTVCTPSRMALLTGSYPRRLGWTGGVVGYGIKPRNGLASSAVTIAEIFKEAGYQTALIGKWHLGDSAEHSPANQGFDTSFYIKKSNNQTKKLWRGEELVADPFDNRLLTEQFAKEAIRFIEANSERPFFLYLPFTAPHFPAQAHPDWKGKSQTQAYGDVVEELDYRVGQILDAVAKSGLEENTIVVFLSDNGVEPGQKKWASSAPYRGLKWSVLEGGNRVPCIVRWPASIPPGRTSAEPIAAVDLMPTLIAACGISYPADGTQTNRVDGLNVLETLTGGGERPHPRSTLLYWNGWGTLQAIRVGKWKLFLDVVKGIPESKNGPVLIDLSKDPAERSNLAQQHPDRVQAMIAEATNQLAEIEDHSIPLGGKPDPEGRVPSPPKWLK